NDMRSVSRIAPTYSPRNAIGRTRISSNSGEFIRAERMCFEPQRSCGPGRIEPEFIPPRDFIAVTMQFAMVAAAQGHRELVAGSSAQRAVLRKAQMMGVARLAIANGVDLLVGSLFLRPSAALSHFALSPASRCNWHREGLS